MYTLNTLVFSIPNYRQHVPRYVVGMLDCLFSLNENKKKKKSEKKQRTSIFKMVILCRLLLSPLFEGHMFERNKWVLKKIKQEKKLFQMHNILINEVVCKKKESQLLRDFNLAIK